MKIPLKQTRCCSCFYCFLFPQMGSHAPTSRSHVVPPPTVVHSSLPLGGTAGSHKQVSIKRVISRLMCKGLKAAINTLKHDGSLFQVSGRFVTASQQKASKTVTARISARPDVCKAARGSLQVMGVCPPMSSVVVERHHSVTQVRKHCVHHFKAFVCSPMFN